MLQKKERLEVVIPIYNEEECIDELMQRLIILKEQMNDKVDLSIIAVDDCSTDGSLGKLQGYAESHDFLTVLCFSRNFGHQLALTAGIDYTTADWVAVVDGDLQDPPELIADMYDTAKTGYDVVYGQRTSREGETWFKLFTAKAFYRVLSRLCSIDIPMDAGDFRIMSRQVADALKIMRERHRFVRGMIPWVGFKSTPLGYKRKKRFAGVTKYPLRRMLSFSINAILSFSSFPLRIATYIGLLTVMFGIISGAILLYCKLFTDMYVPGITATILTILIMGGVQILFMGVMSEYLGKIFEEVKGRQLYIIRDIIGKKKNTDDL